MSTDPPPTSSAPGAEASRAWRTAAVWAAVLLLLALWLHGDEGPHNLRALQWLNQELPAGLPAAWQRAAWPALVSWLTVLGDTHVVLILWLWWVLHHTGRTRTQRDQAREPQGLNGGIAGCVPTRICAAMMLTLLLGSICSLVSKEAFDAPRPASNVYVFEAWQPLLNIIGSRLVEHAFPSGHSIAAFAGVGVLLPMLASPLARHLALAAASLVALSRVAAGAHWPVDVVAGALLGLGCSLLAEWGARHLLRHPGRRATLGRGLATAAQLLLVANALVAPFRDLGYPLARGVTLLALAACAVEAVRAVQRLRAAPQA